jgi:hypothetical protein
LARHAGKEGRAATCALLLPPPAHWAACLIDGALTTMKSEECSCCITRQDVKLIVFVLALIVIMLGVIADRVH